MQIDSEFMFWLCDIWQFNTASMNLGSFFAEWGYSLVDQFVLFMLLSAFILFIFCMYFPLGNTDDFPFLLPVHKSVMVHSYSVAYFLPAKPVLMQLGVDSENATRWRQSQHHPGRVVQTRLKKEAGDFPLNSPSEIGMGAAEGLALGLRCFVTAGSSEETHCHEVPGNTVSHRQLLRTWVSFQNSFCREALLFFTVHCGIPQILNLFLKIKTFLKYLKINITHSLRLQPYLHSYLY